MFTPLELYLLVILFTCTIDLVICCAYARDWDEIGASRSRPTDPASVVDSILCEWRPYFDPMDDLGPEEQKYHAA
ncbi:MAG TPA: hypothetical protein VG815_15535 [Chloroflexota bacterium]|nr:hypothetical protein [Chloroflexota bacterium]